MRCFLLVALVLLVPSLCQAGFSYSIVPSSPTTHINGLSSGPGEDFVLTNTEVIGPAGSSMPLYLDLGMQYDHSDSSGNIFYKPEDSIYQLYVLNGLLGTGAAPQLMGILTGSAEAIYLGNGQYNFVATAYTSSMPSTGIYDSMTTISVNYNTNLPLGSQMEGGSLFVTVNAVVPSPPSGAMMAIGGIGVIGLVVRRRR